MAVIKIDRSIEDVYDSVIKQIISIKKDNGVKGAILYVDCRGGAAGDGSILMLELKKLGKKIPIIAFVKNFAASGGYLVAAVSDKIIASPGSHIGSIGTAWCCEEWKKVSVDRNGYKADVDSHIMVKGEYKRAYKEQVFSDKHKNMINDILDNIYKWFVEQVSDLRGISLDDANKWADGKLFAAQDALRLGLIDEVGAISDVDETMQQIIKEKYKDKFDGIKYIDQNGKLVF